MLDMSKAFDTVDRGKVFKILKAILNDDEQHLMKVLIQDVKLQVRIGNQMGDTFNTNIGVPQGDCLSPVLFTLYLANALEEIKREGTELPKHLQDHDYTESQEYLNIDLQYADDISWVSNANHTIDNVKKRIPEQ